MAQSVQKIVIEFSEEGLDAIREANQSLCESLVELRKLNKRLAQVEMAITRQSRSVGRRGMSATDQLGSLDAERRLGDQVKTNE